jgi:hypothetical protein
MTVWDTDHDGALSAAELEKTPALRAGLKKLDANRDGRVTSEEIAERVSEWISAAFGRIPVTCHVTLDGKPLDGAIVTLTPDECFGKAITPATGKTGASGVGKLKSEGVTHAVYLGWYRVNISKEEGGKEVVPAKYNAASILGQEISADATNLQNTWLIELKSGK